MRKRYASKQNFILVSNLHGVDMFPKIGDFLCSTLTTKQSETPHYDERDNLPMKVKVWTIALNRPFVVREIAVEQCES